MAIVTERFELSGRQFVCTYSNSNRYVVRDGVSYCEANDPAEYERTYTEGDLMTADEIAAMSEGVLEILLGVSE